MKNHHLQGFTLVEMSVVIVIIGTVVGAIIYGTSLFNNAKLQTIITDADSYSTAVANFKQTYQSLPGDFTTAQSMWGVDSGCTTTSGSLTGLGAGSGSSGTCNGDGDGMLTNSNAAESFLFWQHLNLAGMLGRTSADCAVTTAGFPGCGSLSSNAAIGFNVPSGSIKGSGFSAIWEGSASSADANYFPTSTSSTTLATSGVTTNYGNVLLFGSTNKCANGLTCGPVLLPDQAAQIDSKMDDGIPASGKVRAFISTSTSTPGCTTAATSSAGSPALYSTTSTTPLCSLVFVLGF